MKVRWNMWTAAAVVSVAAAAGNAQVDADFNRDGQVTPADVAAYVNTWLSDLTNRTTMTDANGDGTVTPSDISVFVNTWLSGVNGGQPSGGWTVLTPSADTRMIYVSSSSGNDANSGLSESAPVRTINAGYQKLRNGYPDWVLLKRGDTWQGEDFEASIGWEFRKHGRSMAEPMVVGAYGAAAARPKLITNGNGFERGSINGSSGNIVLTGIHFRPVNPGTGHGIEWQGGGAGSGFIIEDCFVELYAQNIVVQQINNCSIRRNIVVDAYDTAAAMPANVGMYASGCDALLIEENLFDHNGWYGSVGPPAIFNHNIYVQDDNTGNVTLRRNIIVNASSHGAQLRSGGIAEDNIFVRNSISLLLGGVGTQTQINGVTGAVRGNIVLEGKNITDSPDMWRASGIHLENISSQGAVVENNILANRLVPSDGYGGFAIELKPTSNAGVRAATIRNNIVYNWRGGLKINFPSVTLSNVVVTDNVFQDAMTAEGPLCDTFGTPAGIFRFERNRYSSTRAASSWFRIADANRSLAQWTSALGEVGAVSGPAAYADPGRSFSTYAASLGEAGTHDAMIALLRGQSKQTWRSDCSIDSLLSYFRAGFSR